MLRSWNLLYQVDLVGVVHIITLVWKSTPAQVNTNCLQNSSFVRPKHGVGAADDGIYEVSAEPTIDDCPTFDAVFPIVVTLQGYIAIDD